MKFKDADLIGIPYRVTVGPKGLEEGKVEITRRKTRELAQRRRAQGRRAPSPSRCSRTRSFSPGM